jgi:hypothetical protein
MLCSPPVITGIMMLFTIHGRVRTIANVIPAVATGALAILLVVPLLTPGLQHSIQSTGLWHQFSKLESLIVSAGAVVSLGFLWSQRRHAKKSEHDKRHH